MALNEPEPPIRPDEGFERHAKAIRAMLPTSRHAQMLFDAVAERLGEDAFVQAIQAGRSRRLFRRDREHAEWLVPWPTLEIACGEAAARTLSMETGEQIPDPERTDPTRNLRGLTRADLSIGDGLSSFDLRCGADGHTFETCISGRRVLHVLSAVRREQSANHVELLAERVAALTPDQVGVGRVRLPAQGGFSPQGALAAGLHGIRRSLWQGEIPSDATFAAADGIVGTAVAVGNSRDATLAAMRDTLRRVQPRPKKPDPLPENRWTHPLFSAMDLDDDAWEKMRADVERERARVWPDATFDTVPITLLPLPKAMPAAPTCPFGKWVGLVDRFGNYDVAAVQHDPFGFTLIDRRLLDGLDADRLTAQLDAVDANGSFLPSHLIEDWAGERASYDCKVTVYNLRDAEGRVIAPQMCLVTEAPTYDMAHFDALALRNRVLRQRWITRSTA